MEARGRTTPVDHHPRGLIVGRAIANQGAGPQGPAPLLARAVRWDPVAFGVNARRKVARPRTGLVTEVLDTGEILSGLRPPVVQPDWVTRFGVALEVLRFRTGDGSSPSVRAIEARRVVEGLRTRITSEGLPQPNLDVLGADFADAFDQWVLELVVSLWSQRRA